MKTVTTKYTVSAEVEQETVIALVTDLHSASFDYVIDSLSQEDCDIIAVAGDLIHTREETECGLLFLETASRLAPVFYSVGNHERYFKEELKPLAEKAGAIFLDNSSVKYKQMHIGGLSSGDGLIHTVSRSPTPDLRWLDSFGGKSGFKLLLSHHPEYYPKYIRKRNIDLTLSGHAHGGQWVFFGRGIFAPGQGFFPKYTCGVYENRLVVSRGLANRSKMPRLFNPAEVVIIKLLPKYK